VHHRLLNDAVETNRRLGLHLVGTRHRLERLAQHLGDLSAERVNVRAATHQNAPRLRLVRGREEEVLEPDCVMPPLGGETDRAVNRLERFRRERN
jgi:hypothetical protein